MGFLRWLRLRRFRKAALAALEHEPVEILFEIDSALIPEPESFEMGEVTRSFHTLAQEIEQATISAKKAREAAFRISVTIGLPPAVPKRA